MNNRAVNNEGGNLGTNSSDQVQSGLLLRRSTSDGVQSQSVGNDRGSSVRRSRSAPQPAVLGSRMAVDPVVDRPASPSGSSSGSPLGSSLPPSESQLFMLNPPVRDVAYGRNEIPIPYHREDDHDLDSSDDEDDIEWEDGNDPEEFRESGPRRPVIITNPFVKRKRCEDEYNLFDDPNFENRFRRDGPRSELSYIIDFSKSQLEKILKRPRCEDVDDGNNGSVEEICDPTYTLSSGEKVDVPIDWFERIESTDLQSIVEDALWILDQEDLDYVRHKCSSDSHYLYERSEEFTSFINDCWRILIDKFNINHETRYLDTISLMKKEMSHNSRCMLSFYSEQSSRIFGEDGDPAGVYLILQGLCARVRYDEHFQILDAVRIMRWFNDGAWIEILEGF